VSANRLTLRAPDVPLLEFRIEYVPSLTIDAARDIVAGTERDEARPVFISYDRASSKARDLLRRARVSFAGQDGRVFVTAPGVLVDRDVLQEAPVRPLGSLANDSRGRNPFAKRSSRIPRWLLLHKGAPISRTDLAEAVDLNRATASRVIDVLEKDAHVSSGVLARHRMVELTRPRALLDAWLPYWERRRIPTHLWDIGARTSEDAYDLLRQSANAVPSGWAVGGLGGAALVRRAVEPGELLVWGSDAAARSLGELLAPTPGSPRRGAVRVAVAPDPWTLTLAEEIDGLPIADPVQLWLDCASEGERALEAAAAIARAMEWT
jgi:hypothetical protein